MPEFRHSDTASLYEYWCSLGNGRPPGYGDWDPIDIPQLMPNVTILEFDEDDEFVHRFAGTANCEFVGVELTGRLLSDFFSPPEKYIVTDQNLRTLLEVPCGRLSCLIMRSISGHECLAELLTLPLLGDSGEADRLIVFMIILKTHGFGEPVPTVSEYLEAEWLDLGCGVPDGACVESFAV
jgi:hypothetical protein